MRVCDLKEILNLYADDLEVYIQTNPDDWAQGMTMKHISLIKASYEEKHGLEQAKVLFTAFHPSKVQP